MDTISSDGDYPDATQALTDLTQDDARLSEPGPLERFRISAEDDPEEIRRKNREAMEAMITELG